MEGIWRTQSCLDCQMKISVFKNFLDFLKYLDLQIKRSKKLFSSDHNTLFFAVVVLRHHYDLLRIFRKKKRLDQRRDDNKGVYRVTTLRTLCTLSAPRVPAIKYGITRSYGYCTTEERVRRLVISIVFKTCTWPSSVLVCPR